LRINTGAIGMPSRARITRVSALRSPGRVMRSQGDAVHAANPLAVTDVTDHCVDGGLEGCDVGEGGDIDRSDRLARVGDAAISK
jgi:hypothetical protein